MRPGELASDFVGESIGWLEEMLRAQTTSAAINNGNA
jgi:hypothetical protein